MPTIRHHSSAGKQTITRRLYVLAAMVTVAGFAAALAFASRTPRLYHSGAGDDRPPADPPYERALQTGLAGDYATGERQMLSLAQEHRGTSEGAWALYQAGIAERAQRHPAAAEALFARLQREYPGHPLALRTSPGVPSPPIRPRVALADCGPRALLALCGQAQIPATLAELRQRCGTTADGTTLEGLSKAAEEKGLRVEALQVDVWFLRRHPCAGMAWVDGDHYVDFTPGRSAEEVSLRDPNEHGPRMVSVSELIRRSQGIVLLAAWGTQSLPAVPAPASPREVQ